MRRSLRTALLGVLVIVILTIPAGASGAPPVNNDFANPTVVTVLPFSDTVDITEATIEPGEPIANPSQIGRTVWYSFTPNADAVAQIGPLSRPPDPSVPPTLCDLRSYRFLVVYRAGSAGFAGLVPVAGDQWSSPTVHTLQVQAGTTYYIQGGQTWDLSCGQNTFSLSVSVVPPPPNDKFSDATPFTSVPFSDSRDLTGASVEPGEPLGCGGNVTRSAWYAFTPTVSGGYGSPDPGVNAVNVYTGNSLSNLTVVDCSDWFGVFFWADAGTTYYLQYYGGGMRINAVPPPAADFRYTPNTPSIFDDVSFSYYNGGYWDPTVNGWSWDFGDGTTGSGQTVSHRYATDGDYSVTLTVAARGGRTNSQTYVVQVRTPDTTPPAILVVDEAGSSDFYYNATSPAGALVEYTATVTDDIDPNPTLSCEPPSGTVWPIGITTLGCTATDASGNTSSVGLDVWVLDAAEQLTFLYDRAAESGGPGTSLTDKIEDTQAALEAGDVAEACSIFNAFINQAKAQSGKAIDADTATTLIDDAARIRAVLGC